MTEQRPAYNLRAVTKETGLTPETLRAWERRYGIVKPQRSAGGHRLYSKRDIRLLKWLVERQEEGLSISRAVELWRNLDESGRDPFAATQPDEVSATSASNLEELRQAWIAACKDFKEKPAEQILSQAFAVATPETVVIEILQKGLAEIGNQWYAGQASVQQEHFSSSLAMRRLHALVAAAPPATRAGRILAACPPGEEHEFALLLSTFLLKRQGWEVIYLGTNVPLEKMEATLRLTSPSMVLSLGQTLPAAASLRNMGILLHGLGTNLAFGGAIFSQLPELISKIPGHYLGNQISNIPSRIDQISSGLEGLTGYEPVQEQFRQALDQFTEKHLNIEAAVSKIMQQHRLPNGSVQHANEIFQEHLKASLALGDADILLTSIQWAEGLLENYGLPTSALAQYIDFYRQAVKTELGEQGKIISQALLQYQVSRG